MVVLRGGPRGTRLIELPGKRALDDLPARINIPVLDEEGWGQLVYERSTQNLFEYVLVEPVA